MIPLNVKVILKKEKIIPVKILEKSKGCDHKIYLIYSNEGNFVLRIPIKEKNKLISQSWAFRQWGKLKIPVPKIISVKKDYLIEELIEGEDMEDENLSKKIQEKILSDLGRYTKRMHSVKTKGFGYFDKEGIGKNKTWKEFIYKDFLETLEDNFKLGVIDKDIFEKVNNYLQENKKILNIKSPRLLHADLADCNIIIKNKNISGIIDASDSISGDPYYDLGVVRKNFGEDLFNEFLKGYGKINKKKLTFYTIYYYNWKIYSKSQKRKNPKKLKRLLREFKKILNKETK
jgi:aminoglycoside phosphotransferase (APT) family kinase protein